ncbi:MAG: hypothetical protein WCK33_07225, partial [Phycisphaerae bacterium]
MELLEVAQVSIATGNRGQYPLGKRTGHIAVRLDKLISFPPACRINVLLECGRCVVGHFTNDLQYTLYQLFAMSAVSNGGEPDIDKAV